MISITQTINEHDLRYFLSIHYDKLKTRRIFKIISAVMIILSISIILYGVISYTVHKDNFFIIMGVVYFLMSLIPVFQKKFSLYKLIKISKSNKLFGHEMKIALTDDNIIEISQADNSSRIKLAAINSCILTDEGIILYIQKNLFYIFKKSAFKKTGYNEFVDSIRHSNIAEIK